MRAAIYDRYWHSMGGGERHSGMIAEVLSKDGVEVDLIGHSQVDRDELAEHLGLDLSGTRMRTVPDKGDAYVAALSAEYDLFVNATYMSVATPQSAHSAYLCFFPTPFDYDMAQWRRTAVRALGPWLTAYRDRLAMGFGTGWYPPEGGRRRQWTWTNGDGVLHLEPGPARAIQFDLGRPGMTEPAELSVEDDRGVIATLTAQQPFQRKVVTLPSSTDGREIRFRSKTEVPGPEDTRTLGVALSRLRLAGTSGRGPRALLASRFPWLLRDLDGKAFLAAYDTVLANSEYTRSWIQRLWQTDADVLYPPIQVDQLHPAAQRQKVVLSVGRFFEPGLGHAKRQLEMVRMFGQMIRDHQLDGWSMTVLGGVRGLPATVPGDGAGGRRWTASHDHAERAAADGGAGHVDRVDLLVSDRARRGRGAGALVPGALRDDHRGSDGRRLRADRHRPGRAAGDRPRRREWVPLVDAGRADGEDRPGRRGRAASRPAVRGGGPAGPGLLRRSLRHSLAYGCRHPRPS